MFEWRQGSVLANLRPDTSALTFSQKSVVFSNVHVIIATLSDCKHISYSILVRCVNCTRCTHWFNFPKSIFLFWWLFVHLKLHFGCWLWAISIHIVELPNIDLYQLNEIDFDFSPFIILAGGCVQTNSIMKLEDLLSTTQQIIATAGDKNRFP